MCNIIFALRCTRTNIKSYGRRLLVRTVSGEVPARWQPKWRTDSLMEQRLSSTSRVASTEFKSFLRLTPAFAHVLLRACYGRGQPHDNATLGLNLFILLLLNYVK